MAKPTPPPPPVNLTPHAVELSPIEGVDVALYRRKGPVHPEVPAATTGYMFREPLVREVAYSTFVPEGARPLPVLLTGPKGCGKTSLILELAARLNTPVYRINLNVGTSVRHLKGARGVAAGATRFYEGVITRAMREGAWLILDELSGATPPVALALFPVLEHDGRVLLEEAEPPRYAARHPDFRVFATDNVIGAAAEDTRFNYAGTNPDVNEALIDRFGATIEVGYLTDMGVEGKKAEDAVLRAVVPGINGIVVELIVRLMSNLRASPIDFGFSTRVAINWAQRMHYGYAKADGTRQPLDWKQALDAAYPAFLNSMRSQIDRTAAVEIITRLVEPSSGAPGRGEP